MEIKNLKRSTKFLIAGITLIAILGFFAGYITQQWFNCKNRNFLVE